MNIQDKETKFEEIYNKTYKNILKFVICKCNNIADVDDIIQETYIELYQVLKNERKILNYKAYLIAIARNKVNKYYRNSSKEQKNISVFKEDSDKDFTIDLDSRY